MQEQGRAAARHVPRVHAGASPVARRSALIHRFMLSYFERYFTRHMNALRIAHWGMPPSVPGGPLIVYSNHPAWWDAAVYILAADRFFPAYESYAPIDAAMLKQYGVFGRIGAFGVDLDTPRGAAAFLASSREILASPKRALWITAQGRFSDVRERPLGLKPGIARLAELAPDCTIVPLAIEYGFWVERGAEAFIGFGSPIAGRTLLDSTRPERLGLLERNLATALDRLSADVRSREPGLFRTVIEGRSGVGGVYDGWRRAMAAMRGRRFDPSHEGQRT
ncbi:1-acyl-sn-glycerol-3-phosphate acyltransferase [Microvirga subterranea]|uniref:1-acyl-sn-glycerol-3-phosphate acyltransferase n=2 Tax=Microvirga subterranea TaxID=186651 RepID=A0A370HTT1_9HYPH|nr:1-acyl-sn-glycerol-3-phosphate acyltransferase [Microvirga subterranea]